ncbi:hypothetical protein CWO17_21410 [Vibrio sp. 10N.286.45.A3]|jgi:hypothetical protein|uniref:hypothetical protein n=2 Tax=Vibrionaceae TaxID=641 RepID=UPI000CF4390C|nr:hypothetical protein [Vibrio sp. F12]PQJ49948.1 hypothetical protein BTO12_19275 [Vibrio splendidus]PTO97421.1 hypothetical protein CWO17_21410 [Vibrio sp. 10N.286.45.A3]
MREKLLKERLVWRWVIFALVFGRLKMVKKSVLFYGIFDEILKEIAIGCYKHPGEKFYLQPKTSEAIKTIEDVLFTRHPWYFNFDFLTYTYLQNSKLKA